MNIKTLSDTDTLSKINNDNPEICKCPQEINFSMSHYKRLINVILGLTDVDKTGFYKGELYLSISPEDYDILKNFANDIQSKEDSAILRRLDQILSKSITNRVYEHALNRFESFMDRIYFTFYNRTAGIFLSCLFIIFISYKLLNANLTIWSVVKYLLFIGWVTDFAFTWINLLQEAEINRMADSLMYESIPTHCNPNKMNFWQYLKYSLSSNSDCRKYHQVLLKDNFWSIAPVTVLSHQFGVVIYTPAAHLGQALGTFTSSLLDSLPWGINIILLPCLLLFTAIVICISFSFLTQTTFSLNFFHLIRFKFGNDERQIMGDVLSGHNLNAILNIAQRNMVEDVRQVENTQTDNSNCSNSNQLQIQDEDSSMDIKKETKNTEVGCEKCLKCSKNEMGQGDISEESSNEKVLEDGSGDSFNLKP